jgi:NADPH:quinone reductase
MRSMLVEEFGEPEVLQYTEAERPTPGEGEPLIEVRFAGVNYADIMRRRNEYFESQNLPFVPGSEVAGTVAEVGEGVEKSQPTTGLSTCSAWAGTPNTPWLPPET